MKRLKIRSTCLSDEEVVACLDIFMQWNFELLPFHEAEKLDKKQKVWIVYKQHVQ